MSYPIYRHRYKGDPGAKLVRDEFEDAQARADGFYPYDSAPPESEYRITGGAPPEDAPAPSGIRWEHESGSVLWLPEGVTPTGIWSDGASAVRLVEHQSEPADRYAGMSREDLRTEYATRKGQSAPGAMGDDKLREVLRAMDQGE